MREEHPDVAPRDALGVILAGGTSRRLGRDKATAPLAGLPMAHHVRLALEKVLSRVVLATGNPDQHTSLGVPIVLDRVAGCGPMAGLEAALDQAGGSPIVVAACDCPLVGPQVLELLRQKVQAGTHDAIVPVVGDRPQPLIAAYGPRCLERLRARLACGQLKMVDFFSDVKVDWLAMEAVVAAGGSRWSFHNVNTPEDLALAEIRLRRMSRRCAATS